MAFHTRFNPAPSKPLEVKSKPRTVQSFKAECDVNRIMARYMATGVAPVGVGVGRYGDFSAVTDFQAAQELVKAAGAQFAALPASVRDRFGNDPAAFLAFVADKGNLEEARKLGLLREEAPAAPPAPPPPVVDDGKPK